MALIITSFQNMNAQAPIRPGQITGARYGVCNLAFAYSITPVNGATGYTWTVSAGTIISGQNTTSIIVSFPVTPATITIGVTADNASGSSPVRSIGVHGKPATPGPVVATPTDWCAGTTGIQFFSDISTLVGTYTLQWSWNPVPAAGNATGLNSNLMTLDWLSQTNHAVIRMRATNACGTSTSYLSTTVTCGQDANRLANTDLVESADDAEINSLVYPNPSHGSITVMVNSADESVYSIKVIDVAGRMVYNEEANAVVGENNFNVDLSAFSKGIYSVIVSGNNTNAVNRISIQ